MVLDKWKAASEDGVVGVVNIGMVGLYSVSRLRG